MVLYIFVMCRGVYVWVLYSMDGLCKNVGGDMVGIVIVWLYCNVWGCVCVGFELYGCVRLM